MSEWISVEERLPEKGVDVLTFDVDGHQSVGSHHGDGWFGMDWSNKDYNGVTHWQPLPPPPSD